MPKKAAEFQATLIDINDNDQFGQPSTSRVDICSNRTETDF